jgi:hypothetical protein
MGLYACGAMPLGDIGVCGSCFQAEDSVLSEWLRSPPRAQDSNAFLSSTSFHIAELKDLCSEAANGAGIKMEASFAGSALAFVGVGVGRASRSWSSAVLQLCSAFAKPSLSEAGLLQFAVHHQFPYPWGASSAQSHQSGIAVPYSVESGEGG